MWIDDVRRPPSDQWTWARSVAEAIKILDNDAVIEASLDFDLFPFDRDGLEICFWMRDHDAWPPMLRVHSANRIGSGKMCSLIQQSGYRRLPGRPRSFRKHQPAEPRNETQP